MMEARGLLLPSGRSRANSRKAFELYKMIAGSALGETGDAYRVFLFSLFDEFAQDLPALFDRFAPQGQLFPREPALMQSSSKRLTIMRWHCYRPRTRPLAGSTGLLQLQGRAQEDARSQPGSAQQPQAGGAQPVLHTALRGRIPGEQHPRPAVVQRDRWANRPARTLPVPAGQARRGAARRRQTARPAHTQAARPGLRLHALRPLRLRPLPGDLPRSLGLGTDPRPRLA